MTIGYKIKKIRELKNFTQEHLADKLGMSIAGYGKIERDEVDIPYSRLEQISQVLGMRTEDLISFDEKFILFNYGEIKGNQIGLNSFPSELKQLYEDKIKLLEDKIEYQQEIINQLKSK